ncbi:AGAP006105-PA-like protein [Anopheles sinensis]|uniref:AGAP006105-PA-like protein n=1 Tax=Anopheles sinensis TaxID=74873 RepID=A0A084WRL6_ANOSI|nr:AGAP006105-PA-like protein [Anopheles sinensis]
MDMDPEKEEYELQHFNFSSEEIVAQSEYAFSEMLHRCLLVYQLSYYTASNPTDIQMVQTLLRSSVSEFTEQFIRKQKIPPTAADQLRANCVKTSIEMYNDCLPAINTLSALYRETFTIPDNVLLPTDLLQTRGQTEELVNELAEEVRTAKEAVMQGAVFLASLDAEFEFHQALEQRHEAEDAVVDLLKDFQEEDVDSDEVSDLVKRLEIAGIVKNDWERESVEFDNFLLQK